MKKKFLSLALVAMSILAFGGNAQAAGVSDNESCTRTECNGGKKCGSEQKCGKAQKCGKVIKAEKKRAERRSVFDKMNLTADQKEKIGQLDQKRREARRSQVAARRTERRQNDSVARAEYQAEKRQYLSDLKSILGPDNYVVFLEDFYLQDQPVRAMNHNKMAHNHKADKARRNRNDKQRKTSPAAAAAAGQTSEPSK